MISDEAKEAIKDKLNVFIGDVNQMTDGFWVEASNDCFNPDIWEEIGKQIASLQTQLNSIKGLCERFKQASAQIAFINKLQGYADTLQDSENYDDEEEDKTDEKK